MYRYPIRKYAAAQLGRRPISSVLRKVNSQVPKFYVRIHGTKWNGQNAVALHTKLLRGIKCMGK